MNSQKILAFVVVMQALTLVGVWSGNSGHVSPVEAQIIDPGAQRLQILDEQRTTNAKLDEMIGLLKGELQVRVITPDEADKGTVRSK